MAESVKQRADSDELIRGWHVCIPWVAVAFGLLTFAALIALAGWYPGLMLGWAFMYFVGLAILAVLNYRLVKRFNAHIKREAVLRTGIIEFMRAAADEQGKADQLATELSTMESIDRDALIHERGASVLITPFAAVPLLGFFAAYYSLHAVTGPTAIHDRRWHALIHQACSAGSKLGYRLTLPSSITIPKRSFLLFLALSLAVFPFLAYWYHVLIRDLNQHFEAQWKIEDDLLKALQ